MSGRRVTITAGDVTFTGELNESSTAGKVWAALPIQGSVNTWGDEIYFRTAVSDQEASDSTDVFELGAVAYWPPGKALCIFFGPTPASSGQEPRMASPGNLVGRIQGDLDRLRKVKPGTPISVAKA